MFEIFLKLLLFTAVYSLPTRLDTVTDLTNENSKQVAEQEVNFDYNEDYSQFKINSGENIDYEFVTPKIVFETSTYNTPTLDNEHEINNLEESKNVGNNMYNNEQNIFDKLSNVFNVGSVSFAKKIPPDFMAPQFMTDLYHTVTEQNSKALETIAYGASAIISLPETNPSTPGLFKFDLTGINIDDILEAELHVYRIGREVSIPLHHSPYYLLRVYQVLPNDNMSWNPDVHQLLNVHYVSSFITGWQVFKVKRALNSWLNESATNLGFLITASTVVNEPIDINFARRNRFSNKYQPSLVLFTKPKVNMQNKNENYYTNSPMQPMEYTGCSKKPMYVNFTTNYFSNFIIQPSGYEAFQCAGLCTNPEYLDSPNYSVLQSALNMIERSSSNICCVPEKMKNLCVLYLSEEKIVLQQIENMIVESCSCR